MFRMLGARRLDPSHPARSPTTSRGPRRRDEQRSTAVGRFRKIGAPMPHVPWYHSGQISPVAGTQIMCEQVLVDVLEQVVMLGFPFLRLPVGKERRRG